VHPAIKKAVCDASKNETDRDWLSKIRPYWGHYYHFHIRIACPKGSTSCEHQPSVDDDNDGCGAELTRWLKLVKPKPQPPVAAAPKPAKPAPERRFITLDQLPAECRTVLASGTPATPPALDKAADTTAAARKAAATRAPPEKATQDKPAAAKQAKPAPTKASLGE
jgi:penicillin-insensitive murein endopeptidase